MQRRQFGAGLAAGIMAALAPAGAVARMLAPPASGTQALEALERKAGGRLGVHVLDARTGQGFGWRQRELFGMCSTFKLSLAALVLRESDAGRIGGDEILRYGRADLLSHSPVTEANLAAGGMSILALAEAAQKTSDNLAANLLLKRLGGPGALTAFWRGLGDTTSRLDRYEPGLNVVPHGDPRDTTAPSAMAGTVARIVAGDVLGADSRALLRQWMVDTSTGLKRLRAGLPSGWAGGDKTGTGMARGAPTRINDIALMQAPDRDAPLVVACFYEPAGAPQATRPRDEAVLADVGRIAATLST